MSSALANNLHNLVELTCQGRLSVEEVEDLRRQLTEALLQARTVTIDLTAVTSLDLACLQLFCAAQRAAVPGGKTVVLQTGSEQGALELAIRNNGFNRAIPCCRDCQEHCLWLHGPGTHAWKGGPP